MTSIVQLNYDELQTAIKTCLKDAIEELKSIQTPAPLPDRISLDEACIELGTKEKPASKAQVYKLTMNNEIPFQKFGKRLVFSRKALREWKESRTVSPSKASEIIASRVSAAAKKHLKK
jgi:excisionase family DNA binding protein